MSTVDKIIDSFPFPTLPNITGEPDYETLSELHTKLNANAASVQTNLGGGTLGHLWLTLKPEVYNTLTNTPFQPPENPGSQPVIPEGATGPATASIRFDFDINSRLFQKYNCVELALKSQLINAVDEVFIQSLRNKYTGYASSSTKDILNYLYDNYAKITDTALQENDGKMRAPYDPSLPIETFFAKIEECQEFAAAGNTAYTSEQILSMAYQGIFRSGVFPEGCKDWRKKPPLEKTWALLKTHFALEYLDLKESQGLTTAKAFQATAPYYPQDTAEAIANLATATVHDREAVANLTVANANLTRSNATLTAELVKVNAELVTALKKIAYLAQPRGKYNPSPSSPAPDHKHYCWSCGTNSPHPSHKCDSKKNGHKDRATKYNNMEGETKTYNK